jgi:hypothetical protein
MKAVLQKLFQAKARLEDAWSATQIDQPDTLVQRYAADDEALATVPMPLHDQVRH